MSLSPVGIRCATANDAQALLAIYRPYVESTAISFELRCPTVEDFEQRIDTALSHWTWLVAHNGDAILGYAYASAHRARPAYRWSVETSAYVERGHHRKGIARTLYTELLHVLSKRGYGNAYAGITLPNAASENFHRSMGFRSIGVFPRVGRKFERWHDVAWMHYAIRDDVQELV